MSSLWYVEGNSLAKLLKYLSNSLDQERLEHPVSPDSPRTPTHPTVAPLPFPCHPESSILIDGQLEGPLTKEQVHQGTGKEFTKGDRCTYIFG
jgi:hypothetical protein